jgi:mono/diheme cytochrome c family protein
MIVPFRWIALSVATLVGLQVGLQFESKAHAAETIPPPPEDATAAKAYSVLDQHCARCHQSGKVAATTPAGGLGNILHLDQLARDPRLIQPGNPDGSKLYQTILMRIAAHDTELFPGTSNKPEEITASELDNLRTWIKTLPIDPGCQTTAPPSLETDTKSAIAALAQLAPDTAKQQRFVSITGLLKSCASDDEMASHREAIGRTINSLSWGLDPVALSPVNEAKTLFQIDLNSIGWSAARWERMTSAYPFQSASSETSKLVTTTGTTVPIMRGDWMTANALHAPLYYELLGLPDRLTSLLASLKINLAADVATGKAQRYGTKTSSVARGARLAQRHEFANGAAWFTFEYAPTAGRQDVFDVPSGPAESGTQNRSAPKPDASLLHFALPSGFTAFYMANADGQRINDIATSILKNDSLPASRITSASSCFGCHANGVRGADDQLRARLAAETQLPKDQHDKLLALHRSPEEQQSTFNADRETLAKSMRMANLSPGLTLHGFDPISVLTQHYERAVTRAESADLLNTDTNGLDELEKTTKGPALDVLQRLHYGPVPRQDFMAQLSAFVAPQAGGDASQRASTTVAPQPMIQSRLDVVDIVLKASKPNYRTGDVLTVSARTSRNCHLTLINVDANGRGTVIFPNDFEQNNAIEAGVELRLPSDAAPYQFRLKEKGRETIIAVCTANQKSADGIVHDFEKQRFTELGDYKSFISRVFATEPEDRKTAPRANDLKPRRTRRGRADPTPVPVAPKDDRAPEAREVQGRGAIQIEIH